MLKLVIFDFDGLMVNSEKVTFNALNKLFEEYNYHITWEYHCTQIGIPVKTALQKYYTDYLLSISFEKFLEKRNEIVSNFMEKNLQLMPGLTSLLNFLKKKNIIMAIATSGRKNYVENYLNKFNILSFFKTIVTIDDVKQGKPSPDLIHEVLKRTDIKSSEAIILEDSPIGIDAANKAHVLAIAVPSIGVDHKKFINAAKIFKNLDEVKNNFSFFATSNQ